MKFFEISDKSGSVVDCTTSLRAAKIVGRDRCGGVFDVDVVVLPKPSRELVRVLLAGQGGYAIESYRVIEFGKPYQNPANDFASSEESAVMDAECLKILGRDKP